MAKGFPVDPELLSRDNCDYIHMANDDGSEMPFVPRDSGMSALMEHWHAARRRTDYYSFNSGPNMPLALEAAMAESIKAGDGALGFTGHPLEAVQGTPAIELPELVAAVHLVGFGETVSEGQIVIAVEPIWKRLLHDFAKDPQAWMKLTPTQFEEWKAGAWEQEGFKVVLRKQTRDGGYDIIATRDDVGGTIRILDECKRYSPHRVVGVEIVSRVHSAFVNDDRASKAVVTTTSRFSPDVYREFGRYMPGRLELWDGKRLQELVAHLLKQN